MIYELKNKISRNSSFLHREDVLTGIIFGNLRYFRNQNILIKFLNESIDLDNNAPKLLNCENFEIRFWEKHYNDILRRYNETDLTLRNDNYIIIIECKYHSPLTEEYQNAKIHKNNEYSNQLIRYSKILNDRKYDNLQKIIIYLTLDKSLPRDILTKSRKAIDSNIGLYWLSWSKLYFSLMEQNINDFLPNELLLYNDLTEFLYKRDLITFGRIIIDNVPYNFHYIKQFKFTGIGNIYYFNYKKYYKYADKTSKLEWRYKK